MKCDECKLPMDYAFYLDDDSWRKVVGEEKFINSVGIVCAHCALNKLGGNWFIRRGPSSDEIQARASTSATSLRQFLLGEVNEEERERIEKLFITDARIREELRATEDEVIEDYLEDNLTQAEKESFIELFAQTAFHRRRVRIFKSIGDWASSERTKY